MAMSYNVPDLVETSSNPAILEQADAELKLAACVRSSVGSRKTEMRARIAALAEDPRCEGRLRLGLPRVGV